MSRRNVASAMKPATFSKTPLSMMPNTVSTASSKNNAKLEASLSASESVVTSDSQSMTESYSESSSIGSSAGLPPVNSEGKHGKQGKHGKKDKNNNSESSDESSENQREEKRKERKRKAKETARRNKRKQKQDAREAAAAAATAAPSKSKVGTATSAVVTSAKRMKSSVMSKAAAAPGENVMLVKQLKPFSEGVEWDNTEYIVRVNKSMKELREISDADGNVALSLGDGSITIERTTPEIYARSKSILSSNNAAALHSDPGKHSAKNQIVHDVTVISAHNGMPVSVTLCLNNIVGSAKSVVYPVNSENELQHLAFSVQQGEKLSNYNILQNSVEGKNDFAFSSSFPKHNPDNLREGVMDMRAKDGVARVLVPHSSAQPHPIVVLAQMSIAKNLTEEERAKNNGNIPSNMMVESVDDPGHYIMSRAVFEEYHARTHKGLLSKTPLSDVANPHGKIWLSIRDLMKRSDSQTPVNVTSKKRIDTDLPRIDSKALWTDNTELETNRTNANSKESAKDTRYNFFARIAVRSKAVAHLATQDTLAPM